LIIRDDGVPIALVEAERGAAGSDGSGVIGATIERQLLPWAFHLGNVLRADVGKLLMQSAYGVGGPL